MTRIPAATPAIAFRRVDVDGLSMNVALAGPEDGPPVLLVHGFPDSHKLWRHVMPVLAAAGYRVVAPDLRGFGDTDMPPRVGDYQLPRLVEDLRGLLDALGIAKVRLVAHDWGAVIGWRFCMTHGDRVDRYAALSVGHPTAYARAPLMQKLKGYYVLLLQWRGFAEWLVRAGGWRGLRLMTRYPEEVPVWAADLARPGRLTAAINYYRANLDLVLPTRHPDVEVPVMGVYSTCDIALVEKQMTDSARFVRAPWRYERLEGVNHWMPVSAPERLHPLLLDFLR